MFDWAKYRQRKGAIKLHLFLDHDGYLPSFAVVTDGVLEHMPLVRTAFFAGLRAAAPRMPIAQQLVVSLEGALWRAQRLADEASEKC
jgi:hypothetical protein